ncbi:MAG: glycosyltransferase, partial [Clostridia bacterium]|nr:glycosyltransferase [Clostridia bacterium]
MRTINTEKIKSIVVENQKLKSDLLALQNQQYNLENRLTQIYEAKSYKLWQKFNRVKKIYITNHLSNISPFLQKFISPLKKTAKQLYYMNLRTSNIIKLISFKKTVLFTSTIDKPLVSVLIPTFGNIRNIQRLLESIKITPDTVSKEIIIMNDNPSKENDIKNWILNNKTLLNDLHCSIYNGNKNMGFVNSINTIAQKASGKYFLLLNDDISVISKTWLSDLVKEIEKDDTVGICGSLLYFPDKITVQHAGMYPFKKTDGLIHNNHYYKYFHKNFPLV